MADRLHAACSVSTIHNSTHSPLKTHIIELFSSDGALRTVYCIENSFIHLFTDLLETHDDTDQLDSMAVRDGEMPGAVLATRVVIGPVRTGYIAHHCRHLVLTTT